MQNPLGFGRARPRLLAVALAAVALVVITTACQPPVTPDNRPTAIPGYTNGKLPDSQLIEMRPGCLVYTGVVPSLRLMIADAAKAGITIVPLYCYRDFDTQVWVREQRCADGNCDLAAVPGTSIHGWGKAIDFGDGTPMFAFASPTYAWMAQFAWLYGWNHPGWARADTTTPEPWHWEWVGDGGTKYPGTTIGPQP